MLDRVPRQQSLDVQPEIVVDTVRQIVDDVGQVARGNGLLHREECLDRLALEELEVEGRIRRLDLSQPDGRVRAQLSEWPQLEQNFEAEAFMAPQLGHATCAAAGATMPAPSPSPAPITAAPPTPPPLAAPSPMPSTASPAAAAWKDPASLVYCTSRRYFLSASSSSGLIEITKLPMRASSRP